jgi:hypothetical protein
MTLVLGSFAEFQKATVSLVMCPAVCLPFCPSVRVEQLGCHWKDFYEIWYISIFSKIYRKYSRFIKIWQEQQALYMKTNICLCLCLPRLFLKWEMFWDNCRENQNTFYVQ